MLRPGVAERGDEAGLIRRTDPLPGAVLERPLRCAGCGKDGAALIVCKPANGAAKPTANTTSVSAFWDRC